MTLLRGAIMAISMNNENVVLFDTAIGSMNKGDEIIVQAAKKQLSELINKYYCASFPTHTPLFPFPQAFWNPRANFVKNAKFKIVLGTNLLYYNMFTRLPLLNVNIFNKGPIRNLVLMGVGGWGSATKANFYTKLLYKSILSKTHIHSTRDERTKRFLESMGFKAINTGCPTLWDLKPDYCKQIPLHKARNVVFTLNGTDYNELLDSKLIEICEEEYNCVYFWPQTPFDLPYFNKINLSTNIKVLGPNLDDYHTYLSNTDTDYIGTRLHAGIYAMQHLRRAIIIGIDSRATEISKTNNINCIPYNEVNRLSMLINSDFETQVNIDRKSIDIWKSQFCLGEQ